MRATEICGCFPTGKHYPGIADRMKTSALEVEGLASGFDPAGSWRDMRLAVLDFETTGLDVSVDRITEIGVAVFENGNLISRHEWLVDPEIPITAESTEVTGITDAMVMGQPKFVERWHELKHHLQHALPVAYNHSFDSVFLLMETTRAGLLASAYPDVPALSQNTWLDPLVWAREVQQGTKGFKLTEVCERLSIPLDSAHRAGHDAEAAGRVLFALERSLPNRYADLIRVQRRLAATQEVDRTVYPRR